jgi:hypothetical protein
MQARQWRVVALAVVSSSGRPLLLKNFPSVAVTPPPPPPPPPPPAGAVGRSPSTVTSATTAAAALLSDVAPRFTAPWATRAVDEAAIAAADEADIGNASTRTAPPTPAIALTTTNSAAAAAARPPLDLQQALAAALDCEDYTETETAQLFLYAALDRIDARRSADERRNGNPFESRGYAVYDRESRTKMRCFVLVRYWSKTLPPECHAPCLKLLDQLMLKAAYAFCEPFRDVALDEPLSESLVMDAFLSAILQPATEMPRTPASVAATTPASTTGVTANPQRRAGA